LEIGEILNHLLIKYKIFENSLIKIKKKLKKKKIKIKKKKKVKKKKN
jgi:hypothetical protein